MLVGQLSIVINRHFPDLLEQLNRLPDYRKRPRYEVRELIVSGLLIFLFKQGSRNQADNTAKNLDYQDNIKRFFGVNVADNDTVDLFLRNLNPSELETIKQNMFREIVRSKVLEKFKLFGQYYLLAIDGTGLQSYDYEPYPGCSYKTQNGKKVWTAYALEAKIVASNGFALSLATEWVENPPGQTFDKQDSENKAFKRLSRRLKKQFPRLPLVLLLDGLYPNNPVFSLCKKHNWRYIITLKDKSLKSVQEKISDQLLFKEYQPHKQIDTDSTHWFFYNYKIFKPIDYKDNNLYIFETLIEKKHKNTKESEQTRFVHVSDIEPGIKNIHKLSQAGRKRWKIENEGFNMQKNNGYKAEHKYSRSHSNAAKNYYELLQIADIINQLTYKTRHMKAFAKKYDLTVKALPDKIFDYLKTLDFDNNLLIDSILASKKQLRY